MSDLLKRTPSGKLLFAIAYEYRVTMGVWAPAMLYVHAVDAADARVQYLQSEYLENQKHMRLVGIAPVIGYFVHDNHGDKLSV